MRTNKVCVSAIVLLACLSLLSCGKDTPAPSQDQDYRVGWLGFYGYTAVTEGWYADGRFPARTSSGSLAVYSSGDSCVSIQLCDSTAKVIGCKVDVDGQLTLIGDQYRVFLGSFIGTDSLYLKCAYYSPATGYETKYYCRKLSD